MGGHLSARARALATTWAWYVLKAGSEAMWRAVARALMVWLWGPPWRPGNTAWLISLSKCFR